MRNEPGIVSSWRAPRNELGFVSWALRVSRSLHRCIRCLLAAIENRGRHGLWKTSQRGDTKKLWLFFCISRSGCWRQVCTCQQNVDGRNLVSCPVWSLLPCCNASTGLSRLAPDEPPYTALIPSGVVRVRMNTNNIFDHSTCEYYDHSLFVRLQMFTTDSNCFTNLILQN